MPSHETRTPEASAYYDANPLVSLEEAAAKFDVKPQTLAMWRVRHRDKCTRRHARKRTPSMPNPKYEPAILWMAQDEAHRSYAMAAEKFGCPPHGLRAYGKDHPALTRKGGKTRSEDVTAAVALADSGDATQREAASRYGVHESSITKRRNREPQESKTP